MRSVIGLQHRVEQADIGAGRFLRHRADAPGAGPADLAVIGLQLAQDHLEQGGFARAVAPDQADAPAGGQVGGGAGQDFPARDPDRDIVDRQHAAYARAGYQAARLRGFALPSPLL